MRTMFQEWTDYLTMVVPPAADATQVEETRRAFYAGAFAMFCAMLEASGSDDEKAAEVQVGALRDEVQGVLQDLALEKQIRH